MYPACKTYEGCVLSNDFGVIKNDIIEMEVKDSDVWICTFPKSGTTWAQEAIWLLGNKLNYDEAKNTDLTTRFQYLEISMVNRMWNILKKYINANTSVAGVEKMSAQRFIKTHLPWQLLPMQIQNGHKKPKIIHVTRNIKDVIVSAYHHTTKLSGNQLSFESFFDRFINNNTFYSPYWKHVLDYQKHEGEPNFLFLTYEDMKMDLRGQLMRIAKFLEIDYELSEADLDKLEHHLSFDSMKFNDKVNLKEVIDKLKNCDFQLIRSGKIGEHKQYFTEEMNTRTDIWIQENKTNI